MGWQAGAGRLDGSPNTEAGGVGGGVQFEHGSGAGKQEEPGQPDGQPTKRAIRGVKDGERQRAGEPQDNNSSVQVADLHQHQYQKRHKQPEDGGRPAGTGDGGERDAYE